MTAPPQHRLAVDLGTSTTIAMLQWPDGRVRPLLFDGTPLLASAVLLGPDGRLLTGRDAHHLSRRNPERLEPNPKRRVDDDVVLLGDAVVPVRDLLAAVLNRVATEAARVAGRIGQLTLTHPAAWGSRRIALLAEAAQRAGLPPPTLVGEPVAAATYFAHTMGPGLPPGSLVLVYDLGAGTCDLTLLRRQPQGFDIVASDGLNDVGGLDVDAAIVAFLEASYGELWKDAVTRRQLWEDVRNGKEMLSRTTQTVITIPSLGTEVPLGREQFNGLIAPVLRPTVSMARSLLLDANTASAPATVVVLVGGASRIPLVATMLHEALNLPPVVIEQPELVVAEGALHASGPAPAGATGTLAAAPVSPHSGGFPTAPVSGGAGPAGPVSGGLVPVSGGFLAVGSTGSTAPISAAPVPAPPLGESAPAGIAHGGPAPARRSRTLVAVVVAALVVVGLGSAGAVWYTGRAEGTANPAASGSVSGSASAAQAKYNLKTTFPQDLNLCKVIDLGRLGKSFDKERAPAQPFSQLANNSNTANCNVLRERAGASLTLTVTATIYADPDVATSQHTNARLNAQDNDPAFKTLKGVGDDALLYQKKSGDPGKDAYYTEAVRDGNLILTVDAVAIKSDGVDWTSAGRAQLTDDLQSFTKDALKKLTNA